MNIFQLNKILLEYNKTGNLTTIAGQGGDKAAGKNFDNIAAGITNPYKQEQHTPTQKELEYPNLAKCIKQMKDDAIQGNKILIGSALKDLNVLLNSYTPQTDENGELILPFGDNVRLTKKGNNFFIRLKSTADKEKQKEQIDISQENTPII